MLLAVALFGLIVPNGLFLYWLFVEFASLAEVLSDRLAMAFILDAFLVLGLLAYLFAKRPPGPVRWPWLVALTMVGGLGFGVPFYLWLNFRRADGSPASFEEWWRSA